MTVKTLAAKKIRVKDSDKGFKVYATRDYTGDSYLYRVLAAPATVTSDSTSNGVSYDTYTYDNVTPYIMWGELSDKATAKLNGLYTGLVDYIAWEFENGIRAI